jgi:orotidine-5'-phosphate decarboxylase
VDFCAFVFKIFFWCYNQTINPGGSMASGEFVPFFGKEKGIVWAADVTPEEFEPIMQQIGDAEGLVGVKIGLEIGLGLKLEEATRIVRAYSDARVQYDHQKAGNDPHDTVPSFVRAMIRGRENGGGVDSAILFPFAGPETQTALTTALQSEGITVFTGAEMTHKRFRKAEGGSIPDSSLRRIIDLALELEVDNFIVPGNKARSVNKWRKHIEKVRGVGNFALAAPGFVDQGGSTTEAAVVAGRFWHPIMGRAVHANKDGMNPREAVEFYTRQLREAA